MTAADKPDLAAELAESAQDRDKVLALLAAEAQAAQPEVSAKARPTKRWLVVRQASGSSDQRVSQHRWEWLADRRVRRLTRNADRGVFYATRRADS